MPLCIPSALATAEAQKRGINWANRAGETWRHRQTAVVRAVVVAETPFLPRGGSPEMAAGAEAVNVQSEEKTGKTCPRKVKSERKTEDTMLKNWGRRVSRKYNFVTENTACQNLTGFPSFVKI